jgi:hypothetical protein
MQNLEAIVLLDLTRYFHREFAPFYDREGITFFHDTIKPDNRELFETAFSKLVGQGCDEKTLAATVYSFGKLYRNSSESNQHMLFVNKHAMQQKLAALQDAQQVLSNLDPFIQLMEMSASPARRDGPQRREYVREELEWVMCAVEGLRRSRKDIVRSYAPIPICIYVMSVTGKCQYALVSTLLECVGYSPNPNRRKQTRDIGGGYDPFDQLLMRNISNFRRAHKSLCKQLEADLVDQHNHVEKLREEETYPWNSETLLAQLDEHWLVIRRLLGFAAEMSPELIWPENGTIDATNIESYLQALGRGISTLLYRKIFQEPRRWGKPPRCAEDRVNPL